MLFNFVAFQVSKMLFYLQLLSREVFMTNYNLDKSKKDFKVEEIFVKDYEKVLKITNEKTKLTAIIALHNTVLGPGLGGIRIYPYESFDKALNDVLRLSKGMTYKSAVAEVGFGGAKSVIIASQKEKTEDLLLSFAEAVDSLQGNYICAEDVGCTVDDVMVVRKKTKYVTGLPHEKSSGDPARYTAWGTFRGIQSVLYKIFGSTSMEGKKIALQGIGSVGLALLDHLFWHGAEIVISDINTEKLNAVAKKYGLKTVEPKDIIAVECDVFAPCAMGGVINNDTIDRLRCKAVAGCANNQLQSEEHGDLLKKKNILYAPDFVINGGGLMNVANEVEKLGYNPHKSRAKIDKIYDTLMSIYEIAEKNNISTDRAAIELAEYRIKYKIGKRIEPLYFHHSSK